MTGEHLPEDLDRWPDDPHELLGVAETADRRTVRRAYTRLIRRYKPEHHPQHFQKIRDAYEVALRIADYYEQVPNEPEPSEEDLPQDFPPVESSVESSSEGTEQRTSPFAEPSLEDQCEEMWRVACDGDLPTAYARLLSLRERHFAHEEICLRLYWLLAVSPELDAGRDPCEWLIESLRADGNAGRSYELYCRELIDRPAEAALARCRSLLTSNLRVGFLSGLAEHRWTALGRLRHWEQIVSDVAALREQWPLDESELWANLLISAIDQLAWGEGDGNGNVVERARRSYLDELEHETQLHSTLEYALVRVDLLVAASDGWRHLRLKSNTPSAWIDLLPLCWNGPRHELHRRMIPVLYDIAKNPATGLSQLDRMKDWSGATVQLLTEAVESFWYETRTDEFSDSDEEAAGDLVRQFFRQHTGSYERTRTQLLEFCLRETISPDVVGTVADDPAGRIVTGSDSVTDHVSVDAPLRCAYAAHRAFWG
jgi:hypothetical protein